MLLKRKYLFGTTILAGVMAVSAPAMAQVSGATQDTQVNQATPAVPLPDDDQEATTVEEIVVTGSRIRRDPATAPTPLIQVPRETLLETGRATVIDYLAQLPALSNSVIPSDTTGSNLGDGGLSLANLRSLGSGRTLTLIDGRRQVGSSGGSLSVDVDTIPRLLIENIEIITGGASSVYGADAVSGVLNFVLRRDFEGLEIDANYGQINQGGGQTSQRISALIGENLFDDRLNVYAFGEYEQLDEIRVLDIDWLEDSYGFVGLDADPTSTAIGPNTDGFLDNEVFSGLRTISRPRWGQTTLANNQQPSPAIDPDVPFLNPQCTRQLTGAALSPFATQIANANCYSVDPTKTYVYEGNTARLANFGQRVGNVGASRTLNIGGDGSNPAEFGQFSRSPRSESQRYQVGARYAVTDSISAFIEAKYVDESTFDAGQPVFFDVLLSNRQAATAVNQIRATNVFDLRYADNAYLPSLVKAAIDTNTLTFYGAPSTTLTSTPGPVLGTAAAPFARHSLFGNDRTQNNEREVKRGVVGLQGDYDRLLFVNNFNWEIFYNYGESENINFEQGVDVQRFALAADAVIDQAGLVNGRPGEIVCRARLIAAQGGVVDDYVRGGDLRASAEGARALSQCTPLNIFGAGNQSAEALAYVDAVINTTELNEQEQAVASVSGQLWDFYGAGPIGVALGVEYRREYTEGVGRDESTGDRFLFLNTGPDFPGAEYESEEAFAELSLPLFRDIFLGEYAELSGSYRYADYTTVGDIDVYGVNLVYRPVQDVTFKSSFNTSVRVPNLGENFSPFGQTFANGFADPCATSAITASGLAADIRANRIANCTALAQAQGLSFDFGGTTATTADDFLPNYSSGIAGVLGGNPFLLPEESDSFTFSTVLQPRWIDNLSIFLDYYEIEVTNVIAAVSAPAAAANCVNGPTLNQAACATIFRNNPNIPFGVGAPQGDPIGGFIQGSINYAKLQTRGLDFSARYAFESEDAFGRDFGRFSVSIGGLWLLEQKQFLDLNNAAAFTEFAGTVGLPRVRFNSSVTWQPTEALRISWNANFQTAQNSIRRRDFILNPDNRPIDTLDTGNFTVHDFIVNYQVNDNLDLRAGVTNAFDAEQPRYLGIGFADNFDPYGTRFNIGLNFRPW